MAAFDAGPQPQLKQERSAFDQDDDDDGDLGSDIDGDGPQMAKFGDGHRQVSAMGLMSLRQNMEEEQKQAPANFNQMPERDFREPSIPPQAMQVSDKHGAEDGVYQPAAQGLDNLGIGANPA